MYKIEDGIPLSAELSLMEVVAHLSGEERGDHPSCACPALSAYGRGLDDLLPDDRRQELVRFIPLLIDSRSTREVELKRAEFFARAAVTIFAPLALEAKGLTDEAAKLRALPETASLKDLEAAADAAAHAAYAAYAANAAGYAASASAAARAANAAANAARAADAYAAAYAARAAADGAAAKNKIYDAAIDIFERAIAIKEVPR